MRSVSVSIYEIDELSEKARQNAYYNWQSYSDYPRSADNEKTLNEFLNIFPVKVREWEYGGCYMPFISFYLTCDDEIANLSGLRLLKYIYNNYYHYLFKGKYYSLWSKTENSSYNPTIPKLKTRHSKVILQRGYVLTGYCIDEDILQPIYSFLGSPDEHVTFYDLIKDCLNSWIRACHNDYKYCYSMDYFIEESRSNGWEYTEDGRRYC